MFQFDRSLDTPDLDFLTLAFEKSGDCIAMLALDGAVLAVNAGGASGMGLGDSNALIGANWIQFWRESDRGSAQLALEKAVLGERGRSRASTVPKTGEHTWWDNTVISVPGSNGKPTRLLAISRNVTEQHEAGQALERSVQLQRALIRATSEIAWHVDSRTGTSKRIGYVEFTGEADDAYEMDGWLAAVHPDDKAKAKRAADEAEATQTPLTIEYRLRHHTGMWRWVEDHATPLIDGDGVLTDWVGIITDIHDRKSAEQALQKSAEHLRLAVEATGLGSWDVNIVTGERDWSPEFFELLRLPRHIRPERHHFLSRVHHDDRARVDRELNGSTASDGTTRACVFRLHRPDGEERWIEAHERTFFDKDQRPIRRVGTMQDITDRKQAERKVWLAAHTDALTGLANRLLFQARLDQAVADAAPRGVSVGLLLIDLDRFKDVNDTLGHDAGDTLLRAVAERLTFTADATATVARLGGDEFGVIVPAVAGVADLAALAEDLLTELKAPVAYEGREVDCSASIGWSVYPEHDGEAFTLLKNADVALYAAKSAGRGRALPFSPAMRDAMERRVAVLRSAKDALHRGDIIPHYQPKVSLATGQITGFEALLRWNDGVALRSPAAIQDALDDSELSIKLGSRMLARVVADMREWSAAEVPFGHVALNAAAPEFSGQDFAGGIFDALAHAGLRPDQLEVEVTERVLLDDGSGAIGTALRALVKAGIQVALDDFGTGYASLTHLTKFPVAWLKIDRSFIENMERDGNTEAIVRAVISLAHNIGIKVVAEGIETPRQLRLLTKAGCDLGQGYLMAKPMTASRVPLFLQRWEWPLRGGALRARAAGADPFVARSGRRAKAAG